MDPLKEMAYHAKLTEALSTDEKMLQKGANGIDVVVKVIQVMEESPLFNVGTGAIFSHNGKAKQQIILLIKNLDYPLMF